LPRKSISKESDGKFYLQIVGAWDGMANAPPDFSSDLGGARDWHTFLEQGGEHVCPLAKHLSWQVVPTEHGAVSFAPWWGQMNLPVMIIL